MQKDNSNNMYCECKHCHTLFKKGTGVGEFCSGYCSEQWGIKEVKSVRNSNKAFWEATGCFSVAIIALLLSPLTLLFIFSKYIGL